MATIYALIKAEASLRLEDESLVRILKCLDVLDLEEVWYAPHQHINSVGNLVLHLCGNIRQYIWHGVGGLADSRERATEFVPNQRVEKAKLKVSIEETIQKSVAIIHHLEDSDWSSQIDVQCFTMSKYSAVTHVIEHTSYHVGQITQLTKWIKEIDTGYYAGMKL